METGSRDSIACSRTTWRCFEPAFQSGPMHYYFNDLPEGADAESFIASWASG